MPKTLDGFVSAWIEAGQFKNNDGKPVSEDTQYKIAFSLWKENVISPGPDEKDVTDQSSGPGKKAFEPVKFDSGEDVPF